MAADAERAAVEGWDETAAAVINAEACELRLLARQALRIGSE